MVNKLTRKAIISINKNIVMYGSEMAKLQEKIDAIDEKYRKMAEEARKDLVSELESLAAEKEIWQTSLSRYDVADVNEILGEISTTDVDEDPEDNETAEPVEAKEDPEQVVDDIFPENNPTKSEEAAPAEDTAPIQEEAPVTPEEALSPEEKDIADLWPSYEEPTEPAEPATEEVPEETPQLETAPAELEVPVSQDPIEMGGDQDFPEFPEEWN